MIVDLDSTDPDGWDKDTHVFQDEVTDSTVWELHVKDFSYDASSGVSEENRGKYLAFTENGTTLNGEGNISTCIDYLKELGVNTVQLNPFYDYASVNEAGNDEQFNWGYDPQNYNVPEGSYSSNPYDGNVRIKECKEMIQALHDAGISVVMDVVYNHTYSTDSCFQKTVPNYYYRLNRAGKFSNGSGCGNECATERAMYRNYVIQSCLYWVNEYHIDGFRYDLMGIMDVETMNQIRDALDKVDNRVTMWGEAWTGGDSYHPTNTCDGTKFIPAIQSNAGSLSERIGIFNDSVRDAIKGGAMSITNTGFVQGSKGAANGISFGLFANSNGNYKWKAKAPSQSVTYADCHDNAALYDQLVASTASGDYGNRYEAETKVTDNPSRYFFYKAAVTFDISSLSYPRTPSWMIFDEKLRTSKPLVGLGISTVGYGFIDWDEKNEKPIASGLILKADSIEELANKIKQHPENKGRMVPANLVEQVTRFNKFCDDKKDADFGRRPATLGKIEQGPFYAMPLVAGGPNTKGGLLADADRRVLAWDGTPIPRLYSVGEIASALKFVYQGGGNLTECLVYGRHVGKNVAGLPDTTL